jgi:hypothetical protein
MTFIPQIIQPLTISPMPPPVQSSPPAAKEGEVSLTAPSLILERHASPSVVPKTDFSALPCNPFPSLSSVQTSSQLTSHQIGMIHNLVERRVPEEAVADLIQEMIEHGSTGPSMTAIRSGDDL